MILYWETCSDCEQLLIKAYGFTMKTPNGVNIGLDYVQEKYVRLVRDGTGRIKRHSNKGKIEHTSFCRMNKQQKVQGDSTKTCAETAGLLFVCLSLPA
jgi:hypothetical protein